MKKAHLILDLVMVVVIIMLVTMPRRINEFFNCLPNDIPAGMCFSMTITQTRDVWTEYVLPACEQLPVQECERLREDTDFLRSLAQLEGNERCVFGEHCP